MMKKKQSMLIISLIMLMIFSVWACAPKAINDKKALSISDMLTPERFEFTEMPWLSSVDEICMALGVERADFVVETDPFHVETDLLLTLPVHIWELERDAKLYLLFSSVSGAEDKLFASLGISFYVNENEIEDLKKKVSGMMKKIGRDHFVVAENLQNLDNPISDWSRMNWSIRLNPETDWEPLFERSPEFREHVTGNNFHIDETVTIRLVESGRQELPENGVIELTPGDSLQLERPLEGEPGDYQFDMTFRVFSLSQQ